MKDIVDFFSPKGIIFKSLKKIETKALGTRKKIDIYLGVDMEGYFIDIMQLEKKSRVLLKEAGEIDALHTKLETYNGSVIKNKEIIIKAPLCSKAKKFLESKQWGVWQS